MEVNKRIQYYEYGIKKNLLLRDRWMGYDF